MSRTLIPEHLKHRERSSVEREAVMKLMQDLGALITPPLATVARDRLRAHLAAPASLTDELRVHFERLTATILASAPQEEAIVHGDPKQRVREFERELANPTPPSDADLDVMIVEYGQSLAMEWMASLAHTGMASSGQCTIDDDMLPVPFPADIWKCSRHPDLEASEGFWIGIEDVRQVLRTLKASLPKETILPEPALELLKVFGITAVAASKNAASLRRG